MPLFAWANGTTPAQIRTQADTDMDLIMGADNWLVVVCPRVERRRLVYGTHS